MSKNAYITSNHLTGIANAIKEYVNIENEKLVGVIPTTYEELVNLRNTSSLRPGFSYRITDYVTSTTQENTISANHQFDIIVTADSENTLNEVARATPHEGDTYFATSDLNAWEIWYCLDNDTDRFAWANTSEEDEEVIVGASKTPQVINSSSFSGTLITNTGQIVTFDKPVSHIIFNGTTYTLTQMQGSSGVQLSQGPPVYIRANSSTSLFVYATSNVSTSYLDAYPINVYTSEYATRYASKGVIYRMIDERGNDCPYDFKNIMFKHPKDTTTYPDYYYTFTTLVSGDVSDHSLNNSYCYSNVIEKYTYTHIYTLNNNVFINTAHTSNCNRNSFGNGCYSNSFGNGCYSNSFGDGCANNSFEDNCSDNSFGDGCANNSFEDNCKNNSFGNNCGSNTFGVNSSNNSFEDNCKNNSFGINCNSNSFGSYCEKNSFRTTADEDGDLLNYCINNTFGDGCKQIVIYSTSSLTSINKLQNIKVDKSASSTDTNYVYYNITTTNSTKPIFVSKEYNTTSSVSDIPIGLYNTSTAINNKVYSTNVTVTPSKSCINAAGGFYETSDERLKNFSDDVMIDLEKLSSLRKKYFTWKDGHGDKQLGVSAQEVQVLYPELVNEGDDGHLSVDYAKLSVVALSAVDKLYNKQKDLEDKLAKIEKALNL